MIGTLVYVDGFFPLLPRAAFSNRRVSTNLHIERPVVSNSRVEFNYSTIDTWGSNYCTIERLHRSHYFWRPFGSPVCIETPPLGTFTYRTTTITNEPTPCTQRPLNFARTLCTEGPQNFVHQHIHKILPIACALPMNARNNAVVSC